MDIEKNSDYKGYGVYKIRLVSSKGLPIKIPRFLGNDGDGILYIGHTDDINKRINFLRGAIQGKQYSSTEGQRLNLIIKITSFIENYKSLYDILIRQNINIIPVSKNKIPVQMLEEEDSSLYTSGELSDFRERHL
ncbi:MAG: hypothetical protein ABSG71_17435 [Thermodesulfobacteriota bacterium]